MCLWWKPGYVKHLVLETETIFGMGKLSCLVQKFSKSCGHHGDYTFMTLLRKVGEEVEICPRVYRFY